MHIGASLRSSVAKGSPLTWVRDPASLLQDTQSMALFSGPKIRRARLANNRFDRLLAWLSVFACAMVTTLLVILSMPYIAG